jgi:hypothetical protein
MSQNVEPKAKMADYTRKEWEALSDLERTAINKAIEAYARAPGTSERVAMLHAVRAFQNMMGQKS